MGYLRYITHPNVAIDPAVAVPNWSLSDVGRGRAMAMLRQPWVAGTSRIVSSNETKALETATLLADHVGLTVEVRHNSGEIDRSATGFVPAARHEELADRFFAEPTQPANGWETAVAAQRRVVNSLADLLVDIDEDIAVVGHGAVGTLLMCHLADLPIDRQHDQPGQGHYWTFDLGSRRILHRWFPIDDVG